jgi:sulfur-oxidizing protein SoxY
MKLVSLWLAPFWLALCGAAVALGPALADDYDTGRAARWKELQQAVFGEQMVQDGSGLIKLDAPPRALDAALVPITVELTGSKPVRDLFVIIDNNPSPVAAHFTFGSGGPPHSIKLRVRVNEYTLMHAVAVTTDGGLYGSERFVKAAGGCSAPAGGDDADALKNIGQMRVRLLNGFRIDQPMNVQLMVQHPNFNGMQMDINTHGYTPARYIHFTDVTFNDVPVFHLESDISISSNPVFNFDMPPQGPGVLTVSAEDSSKAVFTHKFAIAADQPASEVFGH